MRELTLKVTRTARFVRLGTPGPHIRRVWFICHGYGYLAAQFSRYFTALDTGENLLIVPEGLSRFYLNGVSGRIGASWMTREARLAEIEDYVGYLDALYARVFEDVERERAHVVALGFSQGTSTICRWLAAGKSRAEALIVWAGVVPPELAADSGLARLKELDITLAFGDKDQYATPKVIAEQEKFLRENDIKYRLAPFEGGHEINEAILLKIAEGLPQMRAGTAER